MSNTVAIQPTTFINHPDGEQSYGVRIYDDYDCDYINLWNREDLDLEPLKILRKVREEASERIDGILDFVLEDRRGMYIAGDWLTWEQIKDEMETIL